MSTPDPKERQQALTQWLRVGLNNPKLELELVSGDASFRRYFRVLHHACEAMAVDAPPPNENCAIFIQVATAYRHAGVRVPAVLLADEVHGFMALEDFGDRLLLAELNERSRNELYNKAIAELPAIAQVTQTTAGHLPSFDAAHIARENALFTDWLLGTHLQLELSKAEQAELDAALKHISDNALEQPQVGVHRDYHARNLMLLKDDSVGVIDFQDAVLGPVTYDLVSLLRDCYVEWDDDWVYSKLDEWAQLATQTGVLTVTEPKQLKRWFDLMGIQRHVKASGIFCRLCHRDGKTGYLNDVPRTLGYIARISTNYPELSTFGQWVQEKVLPAWQQKQ